MATWIAHLRIAENILKNMDDLDSIAFILGNVGPDSGVPNEDWSSFNPPKKITHWINEENNIDAERFFDRYLKNNLMEYSKYSYVLGYYIHLLTDIEWSKFFNEKKKNALYNKKLKEDASFIWTIKKDWYGLDFLYLEKNPNFIFHTIFKNIDEVPDYIDYFPKGALMKQVKYITEYYLGDNEETKENFIYLNEEEMDKFIDDTSKKINGILKGKIQ
ncbi:MULTISPECIES: zinc dependent phospholipase C family protein [unclassified Clostridium]|uniref:zinc dependent phospholipase C family protein n=1 Tax=unclassified Clostridium TaxID=2614128 RepID=UPI003217D0FF